MATQRARKLIKMEKDTPKQEEEAIDKISDMPLDILSRILSLMPTKSAAQTSVLSKKWKRERAWNSVSTFKVQSLYYHNRTSFNKFVDKFFQNRQKTMESITSFDLSMVYHGAKRRIDSMLDSIASPEVKDFKLNFISATVDRSKVHIYPFPQSILFRMSSLNTLELEDIKWPLGYKEEYPIAFPLIKSLSLDKIYGLLDHHLKSLLSNSPNLQDLVLKNCIDLGNPIIKSSSLKSVTMIAKSISCYTRVIVIEAENVESLFYNRGSSRQICSLRLESCFSIKRLSVANANIKDWWLKYVVPKLPYLEELVLESCNDLWHIEIKSETLVRLVIKKTGNCLQKQVTVVAPKLDFFRFYDDSIMRLSMVAHESLVAEIQISTWRVIGTRFSQAFYENLLVFLSNLDICKELSIYITNEKALIIPNYLRIEYLPPLPTLKLLNVKMENSLFRKRIFRASLNWISPTVETLTIEEKIHFD